MGPCCCRLGHSGGSSTRVGTHTAAECQDSRSRGGHHQAMWTTDSAQQHCSTRDGANKAHAGRTAVHTVSGKEPHFHAPAQLHSQGQPARPSPLSGAHLSQVSQRGQAFARLAAYHGYRITSDSAHARNMAPTAGLSCTSGTAATTPNSTLLRPAHCIRAVTGDPPTRPTAACRISRAEAS